MPQLNANTPYIKAFVRNAFLFSDFANRELTECYIFGAKSIINKPLLFHCQLDNGAIFWGLPISAFVLNDPFDIISEDDGERLSMLQYWDMQSNDIAVTTFTYLQNADVEVKRRDGKWTHGRYMFTIDNYYSDLNALSSGYATDTDSKCYHIIAGIDNNLYAYPNNFILWHNLNFVTPFDKENPPKYKPVEFNIKSEYVKERQEFKWEIMDKPVSQDYIIKQTEKNFYCSAKCNSILTERCHKQCEKCIQEIAKITLST